jgi:subtilisin family serine protease
VRFLALVVLIIAALPAQAQAADIIVKREAGLDRAERATVRRDAGVTLVGTLTLADTEVVHADDPRAALAALNADPDVSYAELDSPVRMLSDDALFTQQWALENSGQFGGLADADMDVPAAWQLSTGAGVTVAVVDTGVDAGVADLTGQLTGNPGEIAGNGVDDDHNGLVDDWRGWDFIAGDNNPADEEGHGTHVTGTVAALAGNGIGVAGVAPDAHVLPVRALDAQGAGTESSIAQAFDYAGDLGARIVNASLGGSGSSQTVTDAIAAHPGTLYVVAAGNSGANTDVSPVFPCTSPAPNVLCVGATDNRDARASYSNYGAATVDVFAPGSLIDSTLMGGGYGFMYGTSMASPQVAGTAALALAADPGASTARLKAALIASVDRLPALTARSVSGGRVNAAAAVAMLGGMPEPTTTLAPVPTATPVPTPEPPAQDAPPAPPQADPPPPAPAPVTPAEVRALKLSGKLRGRSGRLQATFTVTRGAPVRISVARGARANAAVATWSVDAHAGANTLRITRRVRGRTLARGRYTLTVAVGGSARTAAFTVR